MRLDENWLIYTLVLLANVIIAATFPITNDESYYIAFSKHLQLSYVDAPPFVSYLNIIQLKLGLISPLSARSLVIVLHLLSALLLQAIVYNNAVKDKALATKLLATFLIAYVVPIFGLFGVFILPDTGLILALSILLFITDNVVRLKVLSWTDSFFLGIGLGIGLLAKYHILPLGGGILLGLWVELTLRTEFRWLNVTKLIVSVAIGLLCALPLFIWNYEHHFASFVFQLQHGFSSNSWQFSTMLGFVLGGIVYLTPWFTYVLLKRGLFVNKHWYLLVPVCGLMIILLASSLRKHILPHWISPAFWLLIPYAVMNSGERIISVMKMCKYNSLIWVALIGVLLTPAGLINVKELSKIYDPDTRIFKDLLLWQELSTLIQQQPILVQAIDRTFQQKQNIGCNAKQPIVATFRWYWASQLEYKNLFPGAKILNLDQNSSSFYLWRDQWSDYANCNILLIAGEKKTITPALAKIMTIQHQYNVHGLGDYRTLDLQVTTATLKDNVTLQSAQQHLQANPHY